MRQTVLLLFQPLFDICRDLMLWNQNPFADLDVRHFFGDLVSGAFADAEGFADVFYG